MPVLYWFRNGVSLNFRVPNLSFVSICGKVDCCFLMEVLAEGCRQFIFHALSSFIECEAALLSVYCGYLSGRGV